jgi:Tol biopolymer transport system component
MRASVFVALLTAVAFAQTPSIDQSLSAKSVTNAEISPDGRYVGYVVQQADWDENEFVQQIWIANVATGDRYPLTSGRKSNQNPLWSPDSKRLAFISERDGKKQIYVINPHGGEAQQLTNEDNGVIGFHWAPDGSAIAFTSTGPDAKAKKDRKEKYGDFEIVEGDYAQVHLWLVKSPAEIPSDP